MPVENAVQYTHIQETGKRNKFKIGEEFKVYMKKRRPIWIPGRDISFDTQISYFSEKLALLQLQKQKILNSQRPRFGQYMNCKGTLLQTFDEPAELRGIYSLKFSPKGKYLITGYGSGDIKITELKTGEWTLIKTNSPGRYITNIRFYPKDRKMFYTSSSSGKIQMFRKEKKHWLTTGYIKEPKNEINALDINCTPDSLVSGGKDATIRIYDMETLSLKSMYERNTVPCEAAIFGKDVSDTDDGGHYMRIFCLKFDPDDPNVLISGGWDNTIKIWDTRIARYPVKNICGPHICGDALDIMDNKIVSGQWAGREGLHVWDMRTGRLVKAIKPENRSKSFFGEFFYTAKFMRGLEGPEGVEGDLIMAGGSGLGGLEILSIRENVVLATFPEEYPILGADQYGSGIAYGGTGNAVHFSSFASGTPPPPDSREFEPGECEAVSRSLDTIEGVEDESFLDEGPSYLWSVLEGEAEIELSVVDSEFRELISDEGPGPITPSDSYFED